MRFLFFVRHLSVAALSSVLKFYSRVRNYSPVGADYGRVADVLSFFGAVYVLSAWPHAGR